MDRISLVKTESPLRNPNAVLIEKGLSCIPALTARVARRGGMALVSFAQKWKEQAARAAEIERLRAMERARLGERISWANEQRWYL